MRRVIVQGTLAVGLVWACLGGEAVAQNRAGAWEVFPYIGHMSFSDPEFGDVIEVRNDFPNMGETQTRVLTSEIDDTGSFGLRFGYHWTKHQMIEFAFGGSSTDAKLLQTKTVVDGMGMLISTEDISEGLSVDYLSGSVNYVYNFFLHRRDKVVAYLSGGVGVVNTSVFGLTAEPDFQAVLTTFVGEANEISYNYGGGIRFFGSEKVGFRIDLRQFDFDTDARGSQDYFEATMGVSLILGGP